MRARELIRRSSWARQTTNEEAHRRAGGRARHNAARRQVAERRRAQLQSLLGGQLPQRGALAGLARQLGVSVATVSRDVAALRKAAQLGVGRSTAPRPMTFRQIRAALRQFGL